MSEEVCAHCGKPLVHRFPNDIVAVNGLLHHQRCYEFIRKAGRSDAVDYYQTERAERTRKRDAFIEKLRELLGSHGVRLITASLARNWQRSRAHWRVSGETVYPHPRRGRMFVVDIVCHDDPYQDPGKISDRVLRDLAARPN